MDIGFLLKQINDRIHTMVNLGLKCHDLTMSQIRVLDYVTYRGGQTTQKDIEKFLGVKHPTVVGLVQRLEKNGYVSCSMDSACKRNKIVTETEKCVEFRQETDLSRKKLEDMLTEGMTQEEVAELKRMLTIMNGNLAKFFSLCPKEQPHIFENHNRFKNQNRLEKRNPKEISEKEEVNND